ncbi:MAG: hypothetical protein AAFP90_11595, partial [Planctomycetota bacterium]
SDNAASETDDDASSESNRDGQSNLISNRQYWAIDLDGGWVAETRTPSGFPIALLVRGRTMVTKNATNQTSNQYLAVDTRNGRSLGPLARKTDRSPSPAQSRWEFQAETSTLWVQMGVQRSSFRLVPDKPAPPVLDDQPVDEDDVNDEAIDNSDLDAVDDIFGDNPFDD